jgi:acetolactate synthase-1/2/3 large subunit
MNSVEKYSDQLADWLLDEGYTHCFFVAGGNIMHILDSLRTRMNCVPFVHEVGATIGAEYFNASRDSSSGKAFALVTAGPGLTNAVTGIAGAWQESRELLVIGGQVKAQDLSRGHVRQRGIQEIDGVDLVSSISKFATLMDKPVSRQEFVGWIRTGTTPRMGPVFLEICLDVQAAKCVSDEMKTVGAENESLLALPKASDGELHSVSDLISKSHRPVILIGGGIDRETLRALDDKMVSLGIPMMTTWNGSDRIDNNHVLYAGRPDTWGQRSANVLIQQADLVIAVGARLSLQQTGFAWEDFASKASVVQIEIDPAELTKGHPKVDLAICADANQFMVDLLQITSLPGPDISEWVNFVKEVRDLIPFNDPNNVTGPGFVDPFEFVNQISDIAGPEDILLPCSSGGAATVSMQTFRLQNNQKLIGNKSLASMGYGLSGAIGAALANPDCAVFLNEGDGGIAQNLQEFGTLSATQANVKVFVWANHGYASIRMTQRNYFNGAWVGCDSETGLGLPNWELLAKAYDLPFRKMTPDGLNDPDLLDFLSTEGPCLIEIPIDPEQTFFPKITSSVQPDGSMKSNPLHLMSPDLPEHLSEKVFKYL